MYAYVYRVVPGINSIAVVALKRVLETWQLYNWQKLHWAAETSLFCFYTLYKPTDYQGREQATTIYYTSSQQCLWCWYCYLKQRIVLYWWEKHHAWPLNYYYSSSQRWLSAHSAVETPHSFLFLQLVGGRCCCLQHLPSLVQHTASSRKHLVVQLCT